MILMAMMMMMMMMMMMITTNGFVSRNTGQKKTTHTPSVRIPDVASRLGFTFN